VSDVADPRADVEFESIPRLVHTAGQRFGDAEALADGDTRLSFRQLASEVERAARAAIACGVEPGTRVAIWAPNCPEWVIAALGAVSAGAELVPLNTRYRGQEAADILRRSRSQLLLTVRGFLGTDYVELLRSAGEDLPELRRIVAIKGDGGAGALSWGDYLDGAERVNARAARQRADVLGPGDVSDLIYTSGTSGRPKGVLCTHGQTLRVFGVWSTVVGLTAGDRYLIVNPFFHTFGYKAGIIACLLQGATIVPEPVFDATAVLKRIQDERITVLPGAPALYTSMLQLGDRSAFDTSSLRLAVTGAAVVPVELVKRMRTELGFGTVLTAYGLTEATGTVTMCRRGDDDETVARTSGRAIPDTEVRAVDELGAPVPVGTPGEIVTRGYHVMRGYVDDPEATAAAIDGDGWLHTGDVGVLDERGNVTITDRIKDMYVVGGFNAYPAEVEQVLMAHACVGEVAVVGIPDERLGEVGAAFVVPRPGTVVDEDEIIAWARERLANFKVPRRVVSVDALPRNPSGKVLKYELRESDLTR
jgi:acyl-CoA synthetase (AMP-forming)/AMP-acid ligase II